MHNIWITDSKVHLQTRAWQWRNEMNPVSSLLARFDHAGLVPVLDEHGDIVGVEYDGHETKELMALLSELSKHWRNGSWIEWRDDDGERWLHRYENGVVVAYFPEERWVSTNGTVMEVTNVQTQ